MNPAPFLALLVVMLASCKQRESALAPESGSAPQPTSTTAPTMAEQVPQFTPAEPVTIPAGADIQTTLGELSAALRNYVSSTRSAPKDFSDFAARARLTAPPPPAGKAYAISAGQVVLVDAKK